MNKLTCSSVHQESHIFRLEEFDSNMKSSILAIIPIYITFPKYTADIKCGD